MRYQFWSPNPTEPRFTDQELITAAIRGLRKSAELDLIEVSNLQKKRRHCLAVGGLTRLLRALDLMLDLIPKLAAADLIAGLSFLTGSSAILFYVVW